MCAHVQEDRGRPERRWVRLHLSPGLCFTQKPGVCSWRLPLQQVHFHPSFLSPCHHFFFIMWKCFFVCVRLKSVIASDNQENDKSYNASFIQLLISFYIQSEVVSLSVSPSLFKRLSLKLMYHFLFIFYNFLDQQWDLKKTLWQTELKYLVPE